MVQDKKKLWKNGQTMAKKNCSSTNKKCLNPIIRCPHGHNFVQKNRGEDFLRIFDVLSSYSRKYACFC